MIHDDERPLQWCDSHRRWDCQEDHLWELVQAMARARNDDEPRRDWETGRMTKESKWKDYYCVRRVSATSAHEVYDVPDDDPSVREGYAIKGDPHEPFIPKDVFEASYKSVYAMGFEGALAAMKAGHTVARCSPERQRLGVFYDLKSLAVHGFANPGDVLATDWAIVE